MKGSECEGVCEFVECGRDEVFRKWTPHWRVMKMDAAVHVCVRVCLCVCARN